MEMRYATSPKDFKKYDTDRVIEEYVVKGLFKEGDINTLYTHEDRLILGGAVPAGKDLLLLPEKSIMTCEYFLEKREMGIINISNCEADVAVDGKEYTLSYKDCLFIGRGAKEVVFKANENQAAPRFYFASAKAGQSFPTILSKAEEVGIKAGDPKKSNSRTLIKHVTADTVKSDTLLMGITAMDEGSAWNSMPPHYHDRRSEVYCYFGMEENEVVFHFMGEKDNLRHIVMRNEQAVISPPWSTHFGSGTGKYAYVWAMSGENNDFSDSFAPPSSELR